MTRAIGLGMNLRPNPLVKLTRSGLRPPLAAYLKHEVAPPNHENILITLGET